MRHFYTVRSFVALRSIREGDIIESDAATPMIYKDETLLPNFKTEVTSDGVLWLTDLGPWDVFPSVTDKISDVLEYLFDQGYFKANVKRLYYTDSEGRMDEIIHQNGNFLKFQPINPQYLM